MQYMALALRRVPCIFLDIYTRKMVPITGRARSFLYFWSFQKQNREEEVTEQNQQAYQFTQGCNILAQTNTPPNPNLYHTQ